MPHLYLVIEQSRISVYGPRDLQEEYVALAGHAGSNANDALHV